MVKQQRKKLAISIIVAFLAMTALTASAEWFHKNENIMGTLIQVELWHKDAEKAKKIIAQVMDEMHRIDSLMSPYKPTSELSKINRDAHANEIIISKEMFELIEKSLYYSELTGGKFDITFASIGNLYDYRAKQKPSQADIQAQLPLINYHLIHLNASRSGIRLDKPRVAIDLGGIAKGHAVDNAIALLKQQNIQHAIVTAGGDSRIIGDKIGRPWMIGIQDPRSKKNVVAVLPLKDTAVSTSGDYERYFVADGTRYHHIINPSTGDSARLTRSATVIGTRCTDTDALSTSLFVMGPKQGIALVEKLEGTEAVIVTNQGKLLYSSGFLNQTADPGKHR